MRHLCPDFAHDNVCSICGRKVVTCKGETMTLDTTQFEDWLERIDIALDDITGLGITRDELPDIDYYDLYAADYAPRGAAIVALENAGWTE